jgi:hypothetical protein
MLSPFTPTKFIQCLKHTDPLRHMLLLFGTSWLERSVANRDSINNMELPSLVNSGSDKMSLLQEVLIPRPGAPEGRN